MVTIKEIAQAVGLSPSTVSIVLGGKGGARNISTQTQQLIYDKARQMGYRPNIAARRLRDGSGADDLQVALFWTDDFRSLMMVRFLAGLQRVIPLLKRKVRLVIFPYKNDCLKDMRALTSASDCHAAIICNASYADMAFLQDTQLAIPVVLYNRICPGYCSVNVDDAYMGALAARALADQGCKNVSILSGPPVFEGMEVRTQGFKMEGLSHGLNVENVRYCDNSAEGGYSAVYHRLRQDWSQERPDGLFCGSSRIAHGALRAFWEAGLTPKEQPKVVAIGNGSEDADAYSIPSLSTVYLPMEDMAAECLRMLMDVMAGKIQPSTSRSLSPRYIARESCGKIREQDASTEALRKSIDDEYCGREK